MTALITSLTCTEHGLAGEQSDLHCTALHCTAVASLQELCPGLHATIQKNIKLVECSEVGYKDGEWSSLESGCALEQAPRGGDLGPELTRVQRASGQFSQM